MEESEPPTKILKTRKGPERHYCCVPYCSELKNPNNHMHQAPDDWVLKKKWEFAIQIGRPLNKTMKVCSKHFKKEDYLPSRAGNGSKFQRLKVGTIPSLNLPVGLEDEVLSSPPDIDENFINIECMEPENEDVSVFVDVERMESEDNVSTCQDATVQELYSSRVLPDNDWSAMYVSEEELEVDGVNPICENSSGGKYVVEVKEHDYVKLEEKPCDEVMPKLSKIRKDMESELEELKDSLFKELYSSDQSLLIDISGQELINHSAHIRLKCKTKDDFLGWLHNHQRVTGATFRVRKTKPTKGKKILYKAEYRCHRNTYYNTHKHRSGPSKKHTGCEAVLKVTIKIPTEPGFRSDSKDHLKDDFPTTVIANHKHNHEINAVEEVKFKDPTVEVRQKFLDLFKNHNGPSRALHIHKQDLMEKFGEEYYMVAADRSICPDIDWARYLYRKTFNEACGQDKGNINEAKSFLESEMKVKSITLDEKLLVLNDDDTNGNKSHFKPPNKESLVTDTSEKSYLVVNISDSQTRCSSKTLPNNDIKKIKCQNMGHNIIEEVKNRFITRLQLCFFSDPEGVTKAAESMLANMNKLKTESEFLSAMHNFGKTHSGKKQSTYLQLARRNIRIRSQKSAISKNNIIEVFLKESP